MAEQRILLIGYDVEGHVGYHLLEAAREQKIPHWIISPVFAFDAPRVIAKFNWIVRGHRPTRLTEFSQRVLQRSRDVRATHIIATGIAPITVDVLDILRADGVRCVNWLTDDPWSPAHRAPWFVDAIQGYDVVFTPRESLTADLTRAGARSIKQLPFAYCPHCHFPTPAEQREVFTFVGGGDRDRVPYIGAMIAAGLPVEAYGGYWDKFSETRSAARGFVDPAGYRHVVSACTASIGLVREQNRDGHVMRSYEVPAMRGLLLAQDTPDHRRLFGKDGKAVRYFDSPTTLVAAAKSVLASSRRREMATRGYELVTRGANSYGDRLRTILQSL